MDTLLDILRQHLNPMALVLGLVLILFVVILILMQIRKDAYDLRFLIMDTESKQPSLYKMGQLLSLIVSTWGFVYQTLHNNLSEFYFTAYMSIWAATNVGNNAFQKWIEMRNQPKDPQ